MPLIESVPPRASTVPSAAASTDWPYLEPTLPCALPRAGSLALGPASAQPRSRLAHSIYDVALSHAALPREGLHGSGAKRERG